MWTLKMITTLCACESSVCCRHLLVLWHDCSYPSGPEEWICFKRVGNRIRKDRIVYMCGCCWVFVFSISLIEKP